MDVLLRLFADAKIHPFREGEQDSWFGDKKFEVIKQVFFLFSFQVCKVLFEIFVKGLEEFCAIYFSELNLTQNFVKVGKIGTYHFFESANYLHQLNISRIKTLHQMQTVN